MEAQQCVKPSLTNRSIGLKLFRCPPRTEGRTCQKRRLAPGLRTLIPVSPSGKTSKLESDQNRKTLEKRPEPKAD